MVPSLLSRSPIFGQNVMDGSRTDLSRLGWAGAHHALWAEDLGVRLYPMLQNLLGEQSSNSTLIVYPSGLIISHADTLGVDLKSKQRVRD